MIERMQKTRRRSMIVLALVLVVILVLFAGCAPADEPTGDDVEPEPDVGDEPAQEETVEEDLPEELIVWESEAEMHNAEKLAEQFEQEYGIPVVVEGVGVTGQRDQLTLDGPAGLGGDVVTWPHDQIGDAVVRGLISPFENELSVDSDVLEAFQPGAIDAMTYEGRLYGLPKAIETYGLFYNKELLSEPPETFDELKEIAQANTNVDADEYAFLYDIENFYFSYGFINGFGGYVFGTGEDGYDVDDLGLNNAGSVEALRFMKSFLDEGLIPVGVNYDIMDSQFTEGTALMIINGPWAVQPYQDAGIDLGVAPLPLLPNGERPISFNGTKGWYISAYSQEKEWARELIEFMTTAEALMSRFEDTSEIPPRLDLADDPAIAEDPITLGFLQQAESSEPMPNIPEMALVWEPMAGAISLILQGELEASDGLDRAVEDIRQSIAELNQ